MEKCDSNIYQEIRKGIQNNENLLLLTALSGKEEGQVSEFKKQIVSERMLNEEEFPLKRYRDAFAATLEEGKPRVLQMPDSVLAEPFYPLERLVVLGGGHIALPLVEIASRVGFHVTVVDDRPSFANHERFPVAKQVLCESFLSCFEKVGLTRNDYVVIITRGHKHDVDCLRQILSRQETIYVGMIGSKKRVAIVKQQLAEEGYEKDRIERICTPIGLAIGAATPEEISISIVAELIKRKRLDASEKVLINRSDLDMGILKQLAELKDDSCCLVTIIDTIGSVPRGKGAKMLVYPTGAIAGSIGGGCSESAIMHDAIRLIGTGKWMIKEIDMTATAEEEGMVCGGKMKVLLEDMPFIS